MILHSAEYIKSGTRLEHCPPADYPEYAFIGRSNVGKSSLINMLTERKGLARISGTPGKTQLISHFLINSNWYLVDLPGFGYAKRSKKERAKWDTMTRTYLKGRTSLQQVFLLIDSRLAPQELDLEFMAWMAVNEIPFVIVFTKTDKLSRNQLNKNLDVYKAQLMQNWDEPPPAIVSSAQTRLGREEILSLIEEMNEGFQPH